MKTNIANLFLIVLGSSLLMNCQDEATSAEATSSEENVSIIDIAQTAGQLASGSSFRINGSSTDSTASTSRPPRGKHGHQPHKGILDGLNLLAPTDEILAIIDAESASDFRGLRISKNGGATVTHYNASGETVTLSLPANGPQGCSFSGQQFPEADSLLGTITKTIIDFGSGTTYQRDTVSITRTGKIIIERSGDATNRTEVTTFENYSVNGIGISGTKTRVSTFDEATGSGSSTTTVTDGKFVFADGTEAAWLSEKTRTSNITIDESTGRPSSGEIVTEVNTAIIAGGDVIYHHQTTQPLVENVACEGRRRGPVSGVLETVYRENEVSVNFGDGTCENRTITLTVNGVTTTKTIGG